MTGRRAFAAAGLLLLALGVAGPVLAWRARTTSSGPPARVLARDLPVAGPGLFTTPAYTVGPGRSLEVHLEGTVRCRSFGNLAGSSPAQKEPSPSVHVPVAALGSDGRTLATGTLRLGPGQCRDLPMRVPASQPEVDLRCATAARLDGLPAATPVRARLHLPPESAPRGYLLQGTVGVVEKRPVSPFGPLDGLCCASVIAFPLGLALLLLALLRGARAQRP